MAIVIKDKMPQGITRLSISFIEKTMAKMDLPGPFQVVVKQDAELDQVTKFRFVKGEEIVELQTDGFSVGYYGEGPTGLKNLLKKFKMVGPDPGRVRLKDGEEMRWHSRESLGWGDGWLTGE